MANNDNGVDKKICETKEEKFIRLAQARMTKINDQFDLLGNLANKNNYKYTESQIDQIINEIKRYTSELEIKFGRKSNLSSDDCYFFKFSD